MVPDNSYDMVPSSNTENAKGIKDYPDYPEPWTADPTDETPYITITITVTYKIQDTRYKL